MILLGNFTNQVRASHTPEELIAKAAWADRAQIAKDQIKAAEDLIARVNNHTAEGIITKATQAAIIRIAKAMIAEKQLYIDKAAGDNK